MKRFTLCLLILFPHFVKLSAADFVVSPNLARPPNTAGEGPFLIPNNVASSYRWQQVYNATDFSALSGPVYLTGISFMRAVGSLPIDVMLPNIDLRFYTTMAGAESLSPIFANNIGADETLVQSGSLHFVDTGAENFGIHVQFAQPFLYDWRSGNLLMDVRNYSPIAQPMGGAYLLGIEDTFGDSVSAIGAIGVNSPNGFGVTAGLVTRFTFVPVPEPSTIALLLVGVVSAAVTGWKRFRSNFSRASRRLSTED